jgi:PAS domain S-box-containing protein
MFRDIGATKQGLILVLVPLLSEILCTAALCWLLRSAENDIQAVEHERQVLFTLRSVGSGCTEVLMPFGQSFKQNDLSAVTKGLEKIGELRQSLTSSSSWLPNTGLDDNLLTAVKDSQSLLSGVESLLHRVNNIANTPNMTMSVFLNALRPQFLATLYECDKLGTEIVEGESITEAKNTNEMNRIRVQIALGLTAIVLVNIVLALLLVRFFAKDTVHRLNLISENARKLAAGIALSEPTKGTDEIAQLDKVIYDSSVTLERARHKEMAVLDGAAGIICWLDSKLRFVLVSPAAIDLWHRKPDDVLGMSLLSLVADESAEPTKQSFYKIGQKNTTGHLENALRTGDGKTRHFSWSVSWSELRRSFFCVAHDVSELKAVQMLKQNFLAMVSHDIRAPLTSVALSLELLLSGKRGPISETVRKELDKADRGTRRLKELADDLLDLGKLESGKQNLELSPVHAYNVCVIARESLEGLAASAEIKLLGPTTDALMLANETRLVQVVVNLVSNAIKFSPAGSCITLAVTKLEKTVEISVSDQGPGIPAQDIPLVFQKFRQSEAKSKIAVKGTGIGLAIVKAIVEAHQGELGIRSELGKGSTFWFAIPAYESEDEQS